MPTMDLTVNQDVLRVQKRYESEYGDHVFNIQEPFQETDLTGNNNFLSSIKTETNSNHAHDTTTFFQVNCQEKDLELDGSMLRYSSLKKAMDLRIHNRTVDGGKRTIFEDAEYFSRNCYYKLLPITFEQVDETIIQTEHNYSLLSVISESEEPEENFSRTMDYLQIRERNYKRRRTKCRENSDQEEVDVNGSLWNELIGEEEMSSGSLEQESLLADFAGQPLDLSMGPVVQEKKTEGLSREHLRRVESEGTQADSDKENLSVGVGGEEREEERGVRVTITRPEEKEKYQPCDLFLNDIARLVPWLIDKDCVEVDILDRTCDRREELRKHRLYYVIAESTWQSFQSTNERVILTSDFSLGQPLRKGERNERPRYLVFDQFSLAKCLAEYCQEIGGCFEYTCVEEERERRLEDEKEGEKGLQEDEKEDFEVLKEEKENKSEKKTEVKEETLESAQEEGDEGDLENERAVEEKEVYGNEVEEREGEEKEAVGDLDEGEVGKLKEESAVEVREDVEESESRGKGVGKGEGGGKVRKRRCEGKGESKKVSAMGVPVKKAKKNQKKESNRKSKPVEQTITKNCQITTRSKSTSESATSQKSDEVKKKERRKRRDLTPAKEETAKKRRTAKESESGRSRRSKASVTGVQEDKGRKREEKKENRAQMKGGKRERREQVKGDGGGGGRVEAEGRSLRSRGVLAQGKGGRESSKKNRRR